MFMFFIIIYFAVARSVGLRILRFVPDLMRVSLRKERIKERNVRRENPLTYTCLERQREFGTLVCLRRHAPDGKQAENALYRSATFV